MSTMTKRVRVTLLAALLGLFAGFAVVGVSSPALAVTCNPVLSDSFGSEAQISFNWTPQCSDGRARISGTISDPLCDARKAIGRYMAYDRLPDGSYTLISNKGFIFTAPNGCGTSSSFTDWTNSPGSVGWKLYVEVKACNSWGCSTPRGQTYTG